MIGEPTARFWAKVDPCRTDGCAVWTASKDKAGYGMFFFDGRMGRAHHFLGGRPAAGFEWDHVKAWGCTNRSCVWPEHLELVTRAENIRRADPGAFGRNKTHCPQGHPYDENNTLYSLRSGRKCRACAADYQRPRNWARDLKRREVTGKPKRKERSKA